MQQRPRLFRRVRLPLLVRMLALLLAAAVTPLIIFGAISIRRGVEIAGHGAEQNLQLVASLAASRLDQLLADTRRLQGVIAATASVVDACSAPPSRRGDALARTERWLKKPENGSGADIA